MAINAKRLSGAADVVRDGGCLAQIPPANENAICLIGRERRGDPIAEVAVAAEDYD